MARFLGFELDERLPPCVVTHGLLSVIERRLLTAKDEFGAAFGEDPDSHWVYSVSLVDSEGEERFNFVDDIPTSGLPESTTYARLKVDVHNTREDEFGYSPRLYVLVTFGARGWRSRLFISIRGPAARETAIGIRSRLLQLIEPHSITPKFFCPSPEARQGLRIIALLCLGATASFLASALLSHLKLFSYLQLGIPTAVAITLSSYVVLSDFFFPYTAFQTKSWERRMSWKDFWIKGFWGLVIFEIIGLALWNYVSLKLFGRTS